MSAAQTCLACGVEKDPAVDEKYPWPDEDYVSDDPIPPFFVLNCEPEDDAAEWKETRVCHACFHKLSPDLWISQRCWEALRPVTPFGELPTFKERGA